MTATVGIRELIQQLDPGARVELYELDLSPITGTNTSEDHVYFHCGTNKLNGPVVWQGKTYQPYAVETEGWEASTKGQAPRPKLRVANIQSSMTTLVDTFDDLVGAKLIRRRTYARYLDAINFPDRVNLIKFSDEFNQWTVVGGNVITNVTFNPYGELSADKLRESSANENHYVQCNPVTFQANDLLTASISAMPAGRRRIEVLLQGAGIPSARWARVDLVTGQVLATANLGHPELDDKVEVEGMHSGWYRIHVSTRAAADGAITMSLFDVADTSTTYLGDGSSGLLLAAAQINLGGKKAYEFQGSVWFRNPEEDPNQALPDDVYFIERKEGENPAVVEFSLASPLDLEGFMLPARQVSATTCPWAYRGPECGYTGTAYFNAHDESVATLAEDVCSKATTGCKVRFGTGIQPFGGFPATRVYNG